MSAETASGADDGAVCRVRLLVAYDGTNFRGLAPQPDVRTVVGELQRVIGRYVGDGPEIIMSGRTDAGVHAWGQVLSLDLPVATDLTKLQRSINRQLGPEIVVRDISQAAAGFHARFDATSRHYRYLILNRDVPDPFLAGLSWHVVSRLDVEAMNEAAQLFTGEHDFSSFCRQPSKNKAEPMSLVRRVLYARCLVLSDDQIRFDIGGSAFCHQMVRSLTGFLVSVGRGKRAAAEVPTVLAAKDRSQAEPIAPPHGLVLYEVDYEEIP